MNIFKHLSGRNSRRLQQRQAIRKARRRRIAPWIQFLGYDANTGRKLKPKQPTILKLGTARRLRYLELAGLCGPFSKNLVIEKTHYHDDTGKMVRIVGAQSVGV